MAAMSLSHDIGVNEMLSGVFGSISLTAWICLLLPQLITNYKTKSADGLSMGFLAIWLFGDVTNLLGALVTGLAPTATTLAAYFCFSDMVLIVQCLYYNAINERRARRQRAESSSNSNDTDATATEAEPLLRRRRTSSAGLPGSQRRPATHEESGFEPIRRVVTGEDETPDRSPWLHNSLSLLAVYLVGAAGWFVSYKAGAWDGPDQPEAPAAGSPLAIGGMVLGYLSAICYLCARVPQIIKNYREKSCEGLALLFFLLSLTGNLTYGASVFSYSLKRADLIKAVPWLLGSLGTIVEDCIIFYQFKIYAPKSEPLKINGSANGVLSGAV